MSYFFVYFFLSMFLLTHYTSTKPSLQDFLALLLPQIRLLKKTKNILADALGRASARSSPIGSFE
jgi:hypothetical protein